MQIQSTTNTFKGNFVKIAYDDAISVAKRDFMRKHIEEQIMPYNSIYEREHRLEPYELKKLIASLTHHTNISSPTSQIKEEGDNFNFKEIEKLPLYNLKRLGRPGKLIHSYRGQSLEDTPAYCLEVLKKAGIKTVIALAGNDFYKEKVEKAGLEYFDFRVDNRFWNNDAFKDKAIAMKSIESYLRRDLPPEKIRFYLDRKSETFDNNVADFNKKFIEFINKMKGDYCYIGCEYGTFRTDEALTLNFIFNSDPVTRGMGYWSASMSNSAIKNLLNNFSEKDKVLLELSDMQFEAIKRR